MCSVGEIVGSFVLGNSAAKLALVFPETLEIIGFPCTHNMRPISNLD